MASDGSVAYCERVRDAEDACGPCARATSHSLVQVTGKAGDRADAAVAVRMQQTGRSKSDCVGYLQRPSGPGDGGE